MTKPTDKQIASEITALKKIKPKVRPTSAFGDDHHAAIDAQIEVLEKRLSNDQVYDRWEPTGDDDLDRDDGRSETIHSSALDALLWRTGQGTEGKPSASWKELT